MISIEPKQHGKLTGMYNEPMKWIEVPAVLLFYGVPFALIFALIHLL